MLVGKKPWQASGISKSILHRWGWWGTFLHHVLFSFDVQMIWYQEYTFTLGQLLEYNWFPCLSIGWFANARGMFEFYNYQAFTLFGFIWSSDMFVQLVGTTLRIWKSFCATYCWWGYKRLHRCKWKVSSVSRFEPTLLLLYVQYFLVWYKGHYVKVIMLWLNMVEIIVCVVIIFLKRCWSQHGLAINRSGWLWWDSLYRKWHPKLLILFPE